MLLNQSDRFFLKEAQDQNQSVLPSRDKENALHVFGDTEIVFYWMLDLYQSQSQSQSQSPNIKAIYQDSKFALNQIHYEEANQDIKQYY